MDNYGKEGAKGIHKLLPERSIAAIHLHAQKLHLGIQAKVDESYFEAWTPNMAYTLGYIWADGHVSTKDRQKRLAFQCHRKDEEIVLKMLEDMSFQGKVYYREPEDKHGRNNGPQITARIGSSYLVNTLEHHGLVHDKTYQDCPFPNVPDEFLPHFVRGYFDGDGYVSILKNGQQFHVGMCVTKLFGEGIEERIRRACGTIERKLYATKSNIFTLLWQSLKDVQTLSRWLYPAGDYIYLTRKRVKMEASYDVVPLKKGPRPLSSGRAISIGGRTLLLQEWLREVGMNKSTFYNRLNNGLSVEEALMTPKHDSEFYKK